jgi:nucleotide-binding universal stress UspA family protein
MHETVAAPLRARLAEVAMYKRALVPLDGSAVAEAIIPFILQIAGPLDMAVRLLRVVEPIRPMVVEGARPLIVVDPVVREREAEEYLARIAAELRGRGVDVAPEVRRGAAPAAILAAAKSCSADLIAMSTHGRSGLGRLLFGSVAEQVLRHADVPVFLMRQTEAQVAARTAT